ERRQPDPLCAERAGRLRRDRRSGQLAPYEDEPGNGAELRAPYRRRAAPPARARLRREPTPGVRAAGLSRRLRRVRPVLWHLSRGSANGWTPASEWRRSAAWPMTAGCSTALAET